MLAAVMLLVSSLTFAQSTFVACPDADLDVAADDAVRALTDDELDWARDVATSALEQIACVPRVADAEDLATLFQARAAAGFYADPRQEFQADLVTSAGMVPGWFNQRLGPDLRRAWEEASAGISGTASLRVWPIPDDGVLYLDGRVLQDATFALTPGFHLVQVAVGAEVLWAWTGDLAEGQDLSLETGLPEPTRVRVVRDNPLLWAGLVAGLGVGVSWFPVSQFGQRRFKLSEGADSFYGDQADPLAELDQDWGLYRTLQGGLAVGTAAASGLLVAHLVLKLRGRGSQ
jgi:hypothetical protein